MWLVELIGSKTTTTAEVVAESDPPAEMCLNSEEPFRPPPRIRSGAEPNMLRTKIASAYAHECDLLGPMSREKYVIANFLL